MKLKRKVKIMNELNDIMRGYGYLRNSIEEVEKIIEYVESKNENRTNQWIAVETWLTLRTLNENREEMNEIVNNIVELEKKK